MDLAVGLIVKMAVAELAPVVVAPAAVLECMEMELAVLDM